MSSAIVPSLLLPGTRSDGGCLPLIRIASAGKLRQAIGDRRTMEGVIMRQARGCGRPRPGRGAKSQGGGSVRTVVEFWRGGLPLSRAFWLWGILGGGLVDLLATMFALALVVAGAPSWVIVLAFVAVLDLAHGAAVLPRHPSRVAALLGEAGLVDDQHRILGAQAPDRVLAAQSAAALAVMRRMDELH